MNIPECVSQMLLENETVLWSGRPEPFSLEDSISKRKLLSRIFACIATFAVLAGVYVLLCHYFAADVKLAVVAFFFLVLAYIACQPIMDRHSISKNCKYFLTEQRVIVVYNEIRTAVLPRSALKASSVDAKNGCVHLLMGELAGRRDGNFMLDALCPPKSPDGVNVSGVLLYNVKPVPALQSLLAE